MPNVGSVSVDIVPDAQQFASRLNTQVTPQANAIGEQIGRRLAEQIAQGIRQGVNGGLGGAPASSQTQGRRSGDAFAGAFDRQVQTKLRAALNSLPPVNVGVATSAAEQKIRDLHEQLRELSTQRIGVDISEADARAKIESLRAELEALGAQSASLQVKADTAAAITQLAALKTYLDGIGKVDVEVTANTGAFEAKFKAVLEQARAALPEITITANSSPAAREIADLRARMEALSNLKLGVDIDAATAKAELDRLKARLDEVAAKDPNIQVKVDAGRAAAELAALQALIDKVDNDDVKVDVDSSGLNEMSGAAGNARNGMAGLIGVAVLLAPAIIPIAGAAVAALAAVGAAAAGAAAGAGVAFAALKPVFGAVSALNAQQEARNPAAAAQQARARADAIVSANAQVQSSEASLANARASAASGAVNAAQRVADAQRQAASSVVTANQQVTAAEQALANSQQQARNAQIALTDARKAAKQQLEDYKLQLADGALAQRSATLAVAQAKENLDKLGPSSSQVASALSAVSNAQDKLNKAMANPSGTELQREAARAALDAAKERQAALLSGLGGSELQRAQAQLAYDQAKQQQIDLGVQQGRLKEQATAAAKAGVEGSKQVVSAQQGVASANQGVANSQDALARAQAGVAEAQRKGAEQVASAQRAAADQARQGAASVASAQASVASAQRALSKAYQETGTAGDASANKVKEAFAGLTPAGAKFAQFIYGLRDSFSGISAASQNGLLPGLQGAIQNLLPFLPQVEKFAGSLSKTMGDLLLNASKALTGPFWTQFFAFLARESPKWLEQLATTVGNITTGLAGLFQALMPVGDSLNGSIADGAKAFADWATSLGKNKGFQEFLAYIKDNLPKVIDFFGAFFGAASALIVALAPLGSVILQIVTAVLKFIASLSPQQLGIITTAVGALALVFTLLIAPALSIPIIIAGVIAVLLGLGIIVTNLWKTNETFRAIVTAAWNGLRDVAVTVFNAVKTAVIVAWEQGIKPALTALWKFLQEQIFPTVRMLWNDVVRPAFTQIGQIIATTWNAIILPALKALWTFISTVLGPAIMWLLNNVVGPIFKQIGEAISWTWKKVISPALSLLNDAIGGMGTIFQRALDAIKKVWSGLGAVIKDPIDSVLRFVQNYLIRPLNDMLGAVGVKFRIPEIKVGSPDTAAGVGPGSAGRFFTGGWTGRGDKYEPAGIVHADEFVIRKESQNALARNHPGLLDYMNRTGQLPNLPGHASGGLVGVLKGATSAAGSVLSRVAGAVTSGASLAVKVLSDPAGALKDFISSMVGKLASTPFAQVAAGAVTKVGEGLVSKLSGLLSPPSGGGGSVASPLNLGGGRVSVAGRVLDATTAGIFQRASQILGGLNLMQGSYSTSVGASGGTHAGAGAMDVWPANGDWKRAVDVLRSLGSVAWHRTPSQGPWASHIHGITQGIAGLSPSAQSQLAAYRAGRNGLGSNGADNHGYAAGGLVKPLLFDRGGYLPTGVSMVRNDTGKPEPLRRVDTEERTLQVTFNGPVGAQASDVVDRLAVMRADSATLNFLDRVI